MGEANSSQAPWLPLEREQVVLYVLAALMLAVGGYRYAAGRWGRSRGVRVLEAALRIEYRVDLNRAEASELELLPGIGPTRAARIIAHREAHGPFRSLADLAGVPGIGRECAEKLRGLVAPDEATASGDDGP